MQQVGFSLQDYIEMQGQQNIKRNQNSCLGWYFQIIFQPVEASDECPCFGVVGIKGVSFSGCFHPTTPSIFMVYSVLLKRDTELANVTTCVSVSLYEAVLICRLLSNLYLFITIKPTRSTNFSNLFLE